MSPNNLAYPQDAYGPAHAYNGGVLSNGYQLQHYQYVKNDSVGGLDRWERMLRTATDDELAYEAQQAQQTLWKMKRIKRINPSIDTKHDEINDFLGLPKMPNPFELMAMNNRQAALAAIERYKQDFRAARESMDPGGLKAERDIELTDRRYVESRKKRREKRQKGANCVVM